MFVLLLSAATSWASDLTGQASVIDGDTIEIHGQRIRILDIDAPESSQTCTKPDGEQWRCGQEAALALADWIARRPVTCTSDSRDIYGRALARCIVGGEDMADWLAVNGWAVPYRDCKCELVRSASDKARLASAGIWASSFEMPWDYRRAQQSGQAAPTTSASQSQASGQCLIKGNINAKGERIYHVPGGEYYDATVIDTSKGERWFCFEADAVAAGWRKSKL